MPLQAFNTDTNGTMFHNMFSPQILSNKQCYLNSQIQTLQQTVQNNVMVSNNRYWADATNFNFIPNFINETLSPPASSTNRRFSYVTTGNPRNIINGLNSATTLANVAFVALTDSGVGNSTFGVFTDKAYAFSIFGNNGSSLTIPSINYGFLIAGVVENPLYMLDLTNVRLSNHFVFSVRGTGTISVVGSRLSNMTTTTTVNFITTASSSNYTFQCAMNSGDGTTVSGLWATHLALVDSTAAPNDFCIGTVPPIVLLGRGAYTLGNLYKFNNVGDGLTNANAYDRWYIAGPQYGTNGDRILMQVYYEP